MLRAQSLSTRCPWQPCNEDLSDQRIQNDSRGKTPTKGKYSTYEYWFCAALMVNSGLF